MKKLIYSILIGATALTFSACNNDDPNNGGNENGGETPDVPVSVNHDFYILNQGSYYSQIEGSLTFVNADDAIQDVFKTANGRTLGDTPQCAVAYGDKIYIGVYESNVIEIIDAKTFNSLKTISLGTYEGQQPRWMVAKSGKVYVSMYNGYVCRIDTESDEIDKTVKVGPNPDRIAIRGNYLYVPNSDGMNYQEGYGTTASKIDLDSFEVVSTFEVPLNPTAFYGDGTNLYLLGSGNYSDITSKVYRVDENDACTPIAEATMADCLNGKLYFVNAHFYFTGDQYEYKVYDVATDAVSTFIENINGVDSPAAIACDPRTGNIIITSYVLDGGYTSYSLPGYAKEYDTTGSIIRRVNAGVGPQCIFFPIAK